MGRSKVKSKKPSRTEVVSKAAPAVVMPTPGELLLQSAHLIATSEYEQAKSVCAVAYEGALKLKDGKLCTDALEILGTIELELGELDEARKVSETGHGERTIRVSRRMGLRITFSGHRTTRA